MTQKRKHIYTYIFTQRKRCSLNYSQEGYHFLEHLCLPFLIQVCPRVQTLPMAITPTLLVCTDFCLHWIPSNMSTHELKNAGCSKHRPKSLHFFILKSSRKRAAKNREHFTNLASNGPISVDFPKNIGFIIFSISELTKQRFLNHLNYKSNSFF